MAVIKPRRGNNTPTTGLAEYELAVDTTNKRIYIGNASGAGELIGSAPAGSNQEVQYNNSGVLGSSANLKFDGSNLQIGSQGDLRLADSDSSHYVGFQAPSTLNNNNIYTLPNAVGSAQQVLRISSVDGNNATLEWGTVSTGGGGGVFDLDGGDSVTYTGVPDIDGGDSSAV